MVKTGIYGRFNNDVNLLEKLLDVRELNIIGAYSPDNKCESSHIKWFTDESVLLNSVDAIIALSPLSCWNKVENFIKNSKHVFFEPSSDYSNYNINKLSTLIEEANVKVQAGFHHRFNPTFLSARPFLKKPKFIQVNNSKKFSKDSQSCSVLLDMLLIDIDIVLTVIKSSLKSLKANAIAINNTEPDIINTYLEFNNGSVVHLTANRISTENSHTLNFYCSDDYTNINLTKNTAWQVKKCHFNPDISLFQENIEDLIVDPIPVKPNNSYFDEFSSFAKSIVQNKSPEVEIETLTRAYDIIEKIKHKIRLTV